MPTHKMFRALRSAGLLCLLLFSSSNAQESSHRAVLMISIDGMHPTYVTEASKHGWKIPVLHEFLEKGAHAARVLNVSPTVTYPNHTTLVTGVLPTEHGIFTNTVFDPLGTEDGAWNWYAAQVKMPTLWHAAKAAGLVTGSVMWPVTVHSRDIDFNVPEYWRNKRELDHYVMEAVSTPPGFLEEAEKTASLFYNGGGDIVLDEKSTLVTIRMIEKARPDFITVHLVSLDHVEHGTGPFSPAAIANLEQIDGMVGRMAAAERQAHPDADIVIVSDHGFFPVHHKTNLNAALHQAGLLTLTAGARPKVSDWKAFAWNSGGSAVVMLHDPNDRATEAQVNQLLIRLVADPDGGIGGVFRGKEAVAKGAPPDAAFLVDWKSGYEMGDELDGAVVQNLTTTLGAHGYLNTHPELNSSFFILGTGIAAGKDLGVIDMRRIAPALARELGVSLPSATMAPLPIRN